MSPEHWKSVFEWISVGLLLLTFLSGYGILHFGNKAQILKDEQLRKFNKDLIDAKAELGRQQERAAKAETELKNIANTAGAANERAGKANERAAGIEKENMELKKRLAWRRIDQEQHNHLVAMLGPYAGTIVQITKLGDMEAGTFAGDIIKTFSDAHWAVRQNFAGIMSPPPYGLSCAIDETTPAGKALAEALRQLPTANVRVAPISGGIASIIVGLKPTP